MAGDASETFGGMRLEAIIVGQKRIVTLSATTGAVNRFVVDFRRTAAVYLLPLGTLTVTLPVLVLPEWSMTCTTIV